LIKRFSTTTISLVFDLINFLLMLAEDFINHWVRKGPDYYLADNAFKCSRHFVTTASIPPTEFVFLWRVMCRPWHMIETSGWRHDVIRAGIDALYPVCPEKCKGSYPMKKIYMANKSVPPIQQVWEHENVVNGMDIPIGCHYPPWKGTTSHSKPLGMKSLTMSFLFSWVVEHYAKFQTPSDSKRKKGIGFLWTTTDHTEKPPLSDVLEGWADAATQVPTIIATGSNQKGNLRRVLFSRRDKVTTQVSGTVAKGNNIMIWFRQHDHEPSNDSLFTWCPGFHFCDCE
jgi:hypothetical protein